MNSDHVMYSLPPEDQLLEPLLKASSQSSLRVLSGTAELENERSRLNLVTSRTEQTFMGLLAKNQKKYSHFPLSKSYFSELAQMIAENPDLEFLGKSIILSNELETYGKQIEIASERIKINQNSDFLKMKSFIEKAKKQGFHILHLYLPLFSSWNVEVQIDNQLEEVDTVFARNRPRNKPSKSFTNPYERAYTRALAAIEANSKGESMSYNLDLQESEHQIITETLHRLAYGRFKGIEGPVEVPISYSDGSEAPPFVFGALTKRSVEELEKLKELPILNIGMLSARHPELDSKVSMYWFRNQEISGNRPAAETDLICFNQSRKMLDQLLQKGPLKIGFFQTGLQPAIFGFYRAVIEFFIKHSRKQPRLEVFPFYFRGDNKPYKKGNAWK